MKALSVKEPWASIIASGRKTIEVRSSNTDYRGELLICASKKPFSPVAGNAICIVNLIDCRPFLPSDIKAARCRFIPKYYAWVLADVRPIKPFPVKGQLGLFDVELPPGR